MENETNNSFIKKAPNYSRGSFIKNGLLFTAIAGVSGMGILTQCTEKKDEEQEKREEEKEKKVSPPEDLMQEHGVLNRLLLIYDHCKTQLTLKQSFPIEELNKSAGIVRSFVEDYHEKHEETYLFPRFKKANWLPDLVDILLQQHQVGRGLTDKITQLTKSSQPTENEKAQLLKSIRDFITMYRPHEAREDTVLFPAFRKLVTRHEYDSIGELFEKDEKNLFGEDGFETMVANVGRIEKQLGVYDLAQFTPH